MRQRGCSEVYLRVWVGNYVCWASGRKPFALWNLSWTGKEITEVEMTVLNPTTITIVQM